MALTTDVGRDIDTDITTVHVRGLLSVESAPTIRAALLMCVAECPAAVVVDVSNCGVQSAALLAVFPIVARGHALRPSVEIILCSGGDAFQSSAGRAALGEVPLYPSHQEAVAAVRHIEAGHRRMHLRIGRSFGAPGLARAAVEQTCTDWHLDSLRDRVCLIVSELATNAVVHAESDVDVEVVLRGRFLHLRVRDRSNHPPVLHSGPDDLDDIVLDHGRGLSLVARVSSGWGFVLSEVGDGKVVWATLRTAPAGEV